MAKSLTQKEILQLRQLYSQYQSVRKVSAITGRRKETIAKYVTLVIRTPQTDEERKRNAVKHVMKRRKKIKEMAIEYMGGCCRECGYKKCIAALEFHHLDPTKKDFSLSNRGYCRSWEKVKKELDKCIMVCANCHREIHWKMGIQKS